MTDKYYFNVKRRRPEENYKDVREYYNKEKISSYAASKNMRKIQEKITYRALDLLDLRKNNALILDAGCGPGFTAMYLNTLGFKVISLDIISDFLNCYSIQELNPIAADMCLPPFKADVFDAIISISVLQWIYKDIHDKVSRNKFISLTTSFERILKPESKILIQFYPKNETIMKDIGRIFTEHTNLKGNFIIDNPNNAKKRKIFLYLKKKNVIKNDRY
ncbi:MAG: class I SAM-dependent methyltransferase [Promethearchaeota archaeon]